MDQAGDKITAHLERFQGFAEKAGSGVDVERLCDYGWLVKPRRSAVSLPEGKSIGLTMLGLTHGNEWAGVAVLNEVLEQIAVGGLNLTIPVAFILGNPWAALENKRFLERDLNRCFARPDPKAKEEVRARDMMGPMRDSAYLIDFHQTMRRTDRPFFIFPHNPRSFAFARQVAPRLTVVTHWGKPFSAEGMCSDEYVISEGGTGISIELGQNGFEAYQIGVGVDAAVWAINAATLACAGETERLRERTAQHPAEVYTWAEIMPWPTQGLVELVEGLDNFKVVSKGDRLGSIAGEPLLAACAGKILFPKYLSGEQQRQQVSRPTEICRIMRQVSESELPG